MRSKVSTVEAVAARWVAIEHRRQRGTQHARISTLVAQRDADVARGDPVAPRTREAFGQPRAPATLADRRSCDPATRAPPRRPAEVPFARDWRLSNHRGSSRRPAMRTATSAPEHSRSATRLRAGRCRPPLAVAAVARSARRAPTCRSLKYYCATTAIGCADVPQSTNARTSNERRRHRLGPAPRRGRGDVHQAPPSGQDAA